MKTFKEIQRAHDMLIAVILGEVPLKRDPEMLKIASAQCDVLCWYLGCEHNQTFARVLTALDNTFKKLGIEETQIHSE